MNKMIKDFESHNISLQDFFNPGIIASYALDNPEHFEGLLSDYRQITSDILDSRQGPTRDALIFMAGVLKQAINIVEVNLGVRGELPGVGEQRG